MTAERTRAPAAKAWEDGQMDATQLDKLRSAPGFFAALDQSGGSTPKALAEYGIAEDRYDSDEQMFDLVHGMRTRVITDQAFDGSRILAAILFEQTMRRRRAARRSADEADRHPR
jgi:fructose-bisphosphate aldolase class I